MQKILNRQKKQALLFSADFTIQKRENGSEAVAFAAS